VYTTSVELASVATGGALVNVVSDVVSAVLTGRLEETDTDSVLEVSPVWLVKVLEENVVAEVDTGSDVSELVLVDNDEDDTGIAVVLVFGGGIAEVVVDATDVTVDVV